MRPSHGYFGYRLLWLCEQAYEKSVSELKNKLKSVDNEHELVKLELQSR